MHRPRNDFGVKMTTSFWQLHKTLPTANSEKQNFDICIVGAGIAGLSTAYWLEKTDPTLKIVVVDKFYLGAGASGRNAGFVTCGSSEHFQKLIQSFGLQKAIEIWKFSEINRKLLVSEIIQDEFDSVDFTQTGSCTVAATAADFTRYEGLQKTMQSAGIDTEIINEKYLSEQYGVNGFAGAIQYLHDGIIHPIKLIDKMKSKLKNTEFIFDCEIQSVINNATDFTIQTSKNQIRALKVISCLNGFTAELLKDYSDLIKPQRGQIILTEPLPHFVKGPCYLTKHLCYFRQLHTGELLIGGFRNHDIEAENTAVDNITDKIQTALNEFTTGYFKNTKNVKIQHRWSGIMGFTPDGQMILGQHPLHKNMYLMGGCSGHGMGLSFHAAKVLAGAVFNEPIPDHFSVSRF